MRKRNSIQLVLAGTLPLALAGCNDPQDTMQITAVSYTHLDVYKRQDLERRLQEAGIGAQSGSGADVLARLKAKQTPDGSQ